MNAGLQVIGFYKFETFKVDAEGDEIEGTRRLAVDWFPNLILEGGLERMGESADYMQACRVGAGSTPPTINDTTLDSQVATTTGISGNVAGAQSVEPYFGWRRRTYRFPEGSAAGNLSEVGVGWGSGGLLFSRALISDPGGAPTTISVGTDETLDVTYELRMYTPVGDLTGTVNIAGVNHAWVSRAGSVTNSAQWSPGPTGSVVGPVTGTALTGPIGPVTGGPSGATSSLSLVRGSYAPNSRKISTTLTAGLTQGNLAGGIRSILLQGGVGRVGTYQIEFDPPIPKDATKLFSLTFEISWARKP